MEGPGQAALDSQVGPLTVCVCDSLSIFLVMEVDSSYDR